MRYVSHTPNLLISYTCAMTALVMNVTIYSNNDNPELFNDDHDSKVGKWTHVFLTRIMK